MKRISNQQLGVIELSLSHTDRRILEAIRYFKYLRSSQIQRLFFVRNITPRARLVATGRALKRMKNDGLIDHLPNRIGGPGSGSTGLIWYLTEAGARLLDLGKAQEDKRTRYSEPSTTFVRHTLAVAECYIQITEICHMRPSMKLLRMDIEPECWRSYQRNGKTQSLRPDLYAETVADGYKYSWFIEMDLDTESVNDIVEKCHRYQQYYLTDKEQRGNHVFPYVLWVVPTEERRSKLIDAIRFNFGNRYPRMNLIITPNELWGVMTEGPREEDLC